jgi:hypothetical protein
MPDRETSNFAHKQLCLLKNSAIRRMTKQASIVKITENEEALFHMMRMAWARNILVSNPDVNRKAGNRPRKG